MKKKIISIIVISIMMTVGILTFHPTTTVKAGGAPKTVPVYVGIMWIKGGQTNQEYADAYNVNVGGLNKGDTVRFYFKYQINGDHFYLIEKWRFQGQCKINTINYPSSPATYTYEETEYLEQLPTWNQSTYPNYVTYYMCSYIYQGPVIVHVTVTATYWSTDWDGAKWPVPSGYSASDTSTFLLYR